MPPWAVTNFHIAGTAPRQCAAISLDGAAKTARRLRGMSMIFESELLRYLLTLAAIFAGGSRLVWLFGEDIQLVLWKSATGFCAITGQLACF
jgi:hypothetical protein